MDSMQLLRSYREDQPEVSSEDLQVLREKLDRHLAATPSRRAPRVHPQRRLVIVGLGVATAACITVGVATAGPAPQASAAAARLLQGAASTARVNSGDGAKTLVVQEEALAVDGDAAVSMSAAYLDRTVTTVQVPAGDGRWTRSRYSLPTKTIFGGAAGRAFEKRDTAGAATAQNPVVETSSDGSFTTGELGGRDENAFGAQVQQLRDLPTDPAALLSVLRGADLGAGDIPKNQAEHVITAATVVLDSGVADGDLQAAVFQALQQQPGVTVTDKSIDLDGRAGVAIGTPDGQEQSGTFQLILDPITGAYLGHQQVSVKRMGAVPAGTVLDSTAITEQ